MAALFLLLAIGGNTSELHDHFDLLEVNHFHNQYGSEVFVQLIFWDWYGEDCRFHAQGWMMMKDAFDTSDLEHQRQYETDVDRWLSRLSNVSTRSRIRSQMKYKGKFVGGRLYPRKHHPSGKYQVRYHDDDGVMRVITADLFRESHTLNDPELDDRNDFPEKSRRGLKTQGSR